MISSDRNRKKRNFNRGIYGLIKDCLRNEGIKGLYRGASVNICGAFIFRGTYFGLYDYAKIIMDSNEKTSQNNNNNLLSHYLVAQAVTLVSGTVAYPFETINRKIMMGVRNNGVQYRGVLSSIYGIYS